MSRCGVSLRTLALAVWACCCLSALAIAQDVRIEVFGLFHPHQLNLTPIKGSALMVQIGEETLVLEESSALRSLRIQILDGQMQLGAGGGVDGISANPVSANHVSANHVSTNHVSTVRGSVVHVRSRNLAPANFALEVPGKIRRVYSGALDISADSGVLLPVVIMDIETAVASVVQAESDPGTPIEALKAQAVAARSYFSANGRFGARGRHHRTNFCDTTHCQFLRQPPARNSLVAAAALATRGLVLAYQDRPFAAMYTRRCGGRTKTPAEIGMSTRDYPYFSVACSYCARNPFRWSRRLSREDAAGLATSSETARLKIDRRLGWNAVPSNGFTAQVEGQYVRLQGTGQGHGVGMCQKGARAMAEQGATFHDILSHYYPNTRLLKVAGPT